MKNELWSQTELQSWFQHSLRPSLKRISSTSPESRVLVYIIEGTTDEDMVRLSA